MDNKANQKDVPNNVPTGPGMRLRFRPALSSVRPSCVTSTKNALGYNLRYTAHWTTAREDLGAAIKPWLRINNTGD